MKRFILMVVVNLLILTTSCKFNSEKTQELVSPMTDTKEKATYNILKAVLESDEFQYLSKYDLIVIVSESVDLKEDLSIKKDESISEYFSEVSEFIEKKKKFKIPEDVLADFIESNNTTSVLKKPVDFPKVKMISRSHLDQIFKEGDYDNFYKFYPNSGGYFNFSSVGFNKNFTEALLYCSRYANEKGAGGDIIYLKKEGGVWKVNFLNLLWIS